MFLCKDVPSSAPTLPKFNADFLLFHEIEIT
jgi:hypothetical protein